MDEKARHPFVDRLIEQQRADGLSGSEMARRLGIAPSSWTRLVSGEIQPTLRIAQAAGAAFPALAPECVGLLRIGSDFSASLQIQTADVAP